MINRVHLRKDWGLGLLKHHIMNLCGIADQREKPQRGVQERSHQYSLDNHTVLRDRVQPLSHSLPLCGNTRYRDVSFVTT